MKIALCFSGLPRFINETFDNLNSNLIQHYDVDVFVHTWYTPNQSIMNDCSYVWSNYTFNENPSELIKSLYNVKGIIVNAPVDYYKDCALRNYNYVPTLEKYMTHFLNEKGNRYFINACYSMWTSIYQSNKLKTTYERKNNFVYDVVIRCRFDEMLYTTIDFESYNMNNIHVSHCCETPEYPYVRDWFAFSNSKNMNIYCDVINNINSINDRITDTERMNERFLYEQIKDVAPIECHLFHSHFIRP